MKRQRRGIRFVLILALALSACSAIAQNYPKKPVRIIVNMAPGGVVDLVARAVGQSSPRPGASRC